MNFTIFFISILIYPMSISNKNIYLAEESSGAMHANISDILLTEFGDELMYELFSNYDPTIISLSSRYKNNIAVCILRKVNNNILNPRTFMRAYDRSKYKIFYFGQTDMGISYNFYIWLIHPIMYRKWKKIYANSKYDNLTNFGNFIRREILSSIKFALGENNEYYKYLLAKYAPLLPYDGWSIYGRDYLKPKNE